MPISWEKFNIFAMRFCRAHFSRNPMVSTCSTFIFTCVNFVAFGEDNRSFFCLLFCFFSSF